MDDKMRILKMLEEGKITSEEAIKLIDAIGEGEEVISTSINSNSKGKKIRIKIDDAGGKNKVNIRIPIALVKLGMKIGKKFVPELNEKVDGVDINDIIESIVNDIDNEDVSSIVDIDDEEGNKILISIE